MKPRITIKVTYVNGTDQVFTDVTDYEYDSLEWVIEQQQSLAKLKRTYHLPCRNILRVEVEEVK